MKKSIITLALVVVLTLGGTALAFANEATPQNVSKENRKAAIEDLIDRGLSFEEAKAKMLEKKYERIDAAVERGAITEENAQEIKAKMTTNSETCTTPGEKKETHKGYGLNKGLKGNGNGQGNGLGRKNGSCKVTQ